MHESKSFSPLATPSRRRIQSPLLGQLENIERVVGLREKKNGILFVP